MAEAEGQEKSEQPTGKRVTDTREKGQVAKSIEINSLAVFGSGLVMLYLTRDFLGRNFAWFAHDIFNSLDTLTLNPTIVQGYLFNWGIFFFTLIGPIVLTIAVISFISNIAQFGFKFSWKVFEPKMSKFNFFANAKRLLFSFNSLVELFKSLVKLSIITLFTYYVISELIQESFQLINFTVEEIVSFMIKAAFTMVWKITLFFTLIASTDFVFQRVKHKKGMMMTKQEVKEEFKQSEGDPNIKQRIRKAMFKAASRRMMKDVPTADVVITNPTHFAVAIKYDIHKEGAPKVLAKGMDEVAQKIKKIALQNNVPLHEDVQLARALFKSCEIGDEIPAQLFKAVAQILAYIYQMKRLKKRKSIV
jgi:flagellar biosynthesis protein FlhB